MDTRNRLEKEGFTIVEQLYGEAEMDHILARISSFNLAKKFGIRHFLKTYPALTPLIFNEKLVTLVQDLAPGAQLIKSIYFDKPPQANWFVGWHQDLTINLRKKQEHSGFEHWRILPDRIVVQPPLNLLENIFTIRIHLDDCTSKNGALRVVKYSHLEGSIDFTTDWKKADSEEQSCEVMRGGALLMKPLVAHASRRTENQLNRRVLHLEFSDILLPAGMEWQEGLDLSPFTNSN
ncbi:MAG: phytanoyl-CoA dioxygenase family protein [Saprospiraceae bacterium]